MTNYKPFPLAPKIVDIIKDIYDLKSEKEACQPAIVRDFFDKASAVVEAAPVEKQDLEIEFDHVKVHISILRPLGSKDKVLPVIMYL